MAGSGIQVYGGTVVDPLNPDPEWIDIRDIAHALSLQCRFNGHVHTFYSVAQHSVEVAYHCSREHSLTGLLHDAAEAYIGDMPSPLKSDPIFSGGYREAEDRLMEAIALRFGTTYPDPPEVKAVDLRMLETERRDLLSVGDEDVSALWKTWTDGVEPYPETIVGMPPLGAELTFLKMFELLGGE